MNKTKKIFYYEIEIYPECWLDCNSDSSTHFSEVDEKDFDFCIKAFQDWQRARKILFKTKKSKKNYKF